MRLALSQRRTHRLLILSGRTKLSHSCDKSTGPGGCSKQGGGREGDCLVEEAIVGAQHFQACSTTPVAHDDSPHSQPTPVLLSHKHTSTWNWERYAQKFSPRFRSSHAAAGIQSGVRRVHRVGGHVILSGVEQGGRVQRGMTNTFKQEESHTLFVGILMSVHSRRTSHTRGLS
jgi:hypothetical protein